MGEQLDGTFVFTILDSRNNLYFVRGDNPLCLYYYPSLGVYVYASTQEILDEALRRTVLWQERSVRIAVDIGDILRISADGGLKCEHFACDCFSLWPAHSRRFIHDVQCYTPSPENVSYVEEIKSMSSLFGIDPDLIDGMLLDGMTIEDVEELLYINAMC